MKLKNHYTLLFITIFLSVNAQKNIIKINSNIIMPKDSIISKSLIISLNNFLDAAQGNNIENKWIFNQQQIQTSLLINEIENIEKSEEFKNDFFYKPYLTNLITIENNQFYIQISYIGINNNTPFLKASIELIAYKTEDKFVFSSPLFRNTKNWNSKKIGNATFHFKDTINTNKINEFLRYVDFYDNKLEIPKKETTYYFCEDDIETQKLIGLSYLSNYNSDSGSNLWSSVFNNQEILLLNQQDVENFDPHDLFHYRLRKLIPRKETNRTVEEALSTLYGGVWGLTWNEAFDGFLEKIEPNRNTDWLKLKKEKKSFEANGHKNYTDFMANALILQKIENEKGFSNIWEILKTKRDSEEYYITLKKLTGITKENYNKEIWKLIKKEMNNKK